MRNTTHELKTWIPFFKEVRRGVKCFEIRKYDRKFKVGDTLILKEFDNVEGVYTGQQEVRKISYILKGGLFGLDKDYVAMSLEKIQ